MKKTFKYRIKTNNDTFSKAEEVLNLCRILYNLCLEQRRNAWKIHQKSISCNIQKKQLPSLKEAFPEFKQVSSQTLQDVIERVDRAFQGFFRRVKNKEKPGFPRFKGFDRYDSFTLKQVGWRIEGKYLLVKNIGKFKIRLSRPTEGVIKTVTIQKTSSGKWFVCFSCDNVPFNLLPETGREIGIDMGCESFLTDSNGGKIDNPRFFKKSQDLLRLRQQRLSQRKRGSDRRNKARVLVAKTHEKVFNQRKDFHFKTARQILKENDVVYIEKLNHWNTWRNLNRSMRDVAWFQFFNILSFKAVEAGRKVIEVPPKNTSQTCSSCGQIVEKDISVRIHKCLCGLEIDRDWNAALNIFRLGQSLQVQI